MFVCPSVRTSPPPPWLAKAAQRQDQAAQRLVQAAQRLAQNDSGLAEAGYDYLAAGSSHPEAHSNHFKDGWIEGQTDGISPLCFIEHHPLSDLLPCLQLALALPLMAGLGYR